MNMLIIGNGFDLAHDRPTKYEDFLNFAKYVMRIQTFTGSQTEFKTGLSGLKSGVEEYILKLHKDTAVSQVDGQVRTNNQVLREIWKCLYKNVWYEYFQGIHKENKMRGKNWIDFEGEIREVIKFFDRKIKDIYEEIPLSSLQSLRVDVPAKIAYFCKGLDFSEYNQTYYNNKTYKNTYFDFIEKTYQDLQKLIRCLEIYLDVCVGGIPVLCYSPDIKDLNIHSVLSFNYTAIPTNRYSLPEENTHYIHGRAVASRPVGDNNMVLGVNEYWKDDDKNTHTNFNLYKKFVQRIIKETGIDYKMTLEVMLSRYKDAKHLHDTAKGYPKPKHNNVYIFGHSLDVTDGDILKEIIQTEGVVTTIFYRNKQQQANQIANLSKVLGQEELLEYTFSTEPTIIFKQQRDMVKL